jgi:hypothetical protein
MNLIDTPNVSIGHQLRGRISITIGKIAVGGGPDKARPCHPGGTEVIRHGPQVHYARVGRKCHFSVSGFVSMHHQGTSGLG